MHITWFNVTSTPFTTSSSASSVNPERRTEFRREYCSSSSCMLELDSVDLLLERLDLNDSEVVSINLLQRRHQNLLVKVELHKSTESFIDVTRRAYGDGGSEK